MFMLEIKICIKNIGVQHSLEKNVTATMFFLKKHFLVKTDVACSGVTPDFQQGPITYI